MIFSRGERANYLSDLSCSLCSACVLICTDGPTHTHHNKRYAPTPSGMRGGGENQEEESGEEREREREKYTIYNILK